jgi:hypothetical protein
MDLTHEYLNEVVVLHEGFPILSKLTSAGNSLQNILLRLVIGVQKASVENLQKIRIGLEHMDHFLGARQIANSLSAFN